MIYSVEPKNINLYSFLFNYIFPLKTVDDRGQCEGKFIQTDHIHLCKYIHSCWTDHSCLEKTYGTTLTPTQKFITLNKFDDALGCCIPVMQNLSTATLCNLENL